MTPVVKSRTLYVIHHTPPACDVAELSLSIGRQDVRTFGSLSEFLAFYERAMSSSECLLLELSDSPSEQRSILDQLRKARLPIPTIVVTQETNVATAVAAIKSGAIDVLAKPFTLNELLRHVDEAFAQKPVRTWRIDEASNASSLSRLTRCERQVLDCILSAMTTKQISVAMQIGPQTAAKHKQRVLRKLGARNDIDLVLQVLGVDHGAQAAFAVN